MSLEGKSCDVDAWPGGAGSSCTDSICGKLARISCRSKRSVEAGFIVECIGAGKRESGELASGQVGMALVGSNH